MNKCLGRIAAKASTKALMFANYVSADIQIPKASNFWTKRTGFTDEAWGNDREGCCTIAKQANMFRRFQRLEHRKTIQIAEAEVHRVYRNLIETKYQAGPDDDTGAYEDDALSWSRSKETCLKDTNNRILTLDAYSRINAKNHEEMKRAIWLSGGHGIAICINLPLIFESIPAGQDWTVTGALVGDKIPGSWGGHSMWCIDYGPRGFLLEQTWRMPETWISYEAASAYIDEAHSVIDSVDSWAKKAAGLNIGKLIADVNRVSKTKVAA